MRLIPQAIKPTSGLAGVLHAALLLVLPVAVFVLVNSNENFVPLAFGVVILSKWRMFAVRPRFWPANIRANAVDLMVGLSIVLLMSQTSVLTVRVIWALLYSVWLLAIKPRTSLSAVTLQAFIGQLAALSAVYLAWDNAPVYGLTLLTGLICFLAAHHFLDAFDEPYVKLLAYAWGYFGAGLAWLLGHWLLFYRGLAQPTLLLSTLGYGLAALYYLDHEDRLSVGLRRQFILVMVAIVAVVLIFSKWGGKVV
jgi:hypothetical protein